MVAFILLVANAIGEPFGGDLVKIFSNDFRPSATGFVSNRGLLFQHTAPKSLSSKQRQSNCGLKIDGK